MDKVQAECALPFVPSSYPCTVCWQGSRISRWSKLTSCFFASPEQHILWPGSKHNISTREESEWCQAHRKQQHGDTSTATIEWRPELFACCRGQTHDPAPSFVHWLSTTTAEAVAFAAQDVPVLISHPFHF